MYALDREKNLLDRLVDATRKEREELECALRRSRNSTAPINKVPDEALRHIFSFCDSSHHHHVSSTCYRWHDVMTKTHSYCKEIRIAWTSNTAPTDTLYAQVQRIQHLTQLDLSFNIRITLNHTPSPRQLNHFQSAINNLNLLPRCTSFSIKAHGDGILEWLMPMLMPFTVRLKTFQLRSRTSNFESIDLYYTPGHRLETFDINAPKLSLTLHDFESTELRKLVLHCRSVEKGIFPILKPASKLTTLAIWIQEYWNILQGAKSVSLPKLETFSFEPAKSFAVVSKIRALNVTTLTLNTTKFLGYDTDSVNRRPFAKLRHFKVSSWIDTWFTLAMLKMHPTVECLSVYGCSRMSMLFDEIPLTYPQAPTASLRMIEIRFQENSSVALSKITRSIAEALADTHKHDLIPGPEHIRFAFEKSDEWPETVHNLVARFPLVVSIMKS